MKIVLITALLVLSGYTATALNCADGQVKCGDGSFCVPNSWKCDGTNDCPDGTDEKGCGLKKESCEFTCGSGKCLNRVWVCDGYDDCGDNSDEKNCDGNAHTNPSSTMKTTTTPTPTTRQPTTRQPTTASRCLSAEFECHGDSKCIPLAWECDGFHDCNDSSDETRCDGNTPTTRSSGTDRSSTMKTTATPTTRQPTTRQPTIRQLTTEQPTTRQPTTQPQSATRQPTTRQPTTHQPTTRQPTTRQPKTRQPKTQQSGTRQSTTQQSATQQSATQQSAIRQSSTRQSTTRQPTTHQPTTRQPKTRQPTTRQSATRQPTTHQPTTRQPITTSRCSSAEFECHEDSKCIPATWKCDSFRDCNDSSDETGCDHVSTTGSTTASSTTMKTNVEVPVRGLSDRVVCGADQILCGTGSCTFLAWKCDGDNDCGDNSDEQNCESTDPVVLPTPTQSFSRSSCPRHQFQCVTSKRCIHNNWVCDQERDCRDGSDETQCVTNPSFVLAAQTSIKKISEDFETVEDLYPRLTGVVAIDVDIHTQFVYWSDVKRKQIRRGNFDGRNSRVVISSRLGIVEGIAVDWVARKLYWTDSLLSSIEVSGLLGQNRKKLIGVSLDKPRGIAVHPSGYIFWTEWGNRPRISRCSMDGKPETRRTIIDKDILWPNAVTIDYSSNVLWWADAKLKKIEHCNLDGTNRHAISGVGYPFSIAVNSRYVYWTNWETNTLDRMEKDTTYKYIKKSKRFDKHPLGISLIDGKKHAAVHSECMINNGGCSHLCLLSSATVGFSCQCPDRLQLSRDSKNCHQRFAASCSSKQFRCDGGKCIDASKKCNGEQDCMDRTDEQYCLSDKPRLVFGNRKRYVAISDLTQKTGYKIISEAESVTGIDVDVKNGYVFWADTRKNAIMKSVLNHKAESLSTEIIADTYVYTPEGLAFDWITNKLYWIDSYLRKIEVIDLVRKHRYNVVNTRLRRPRSIAVHPKSRYLFWTDWGRRPCVAAIGMDGDPDTRREVINTEIVWPNAVTIDYSSDTLYWADAYYDKIEKISINGGPRAYFMTSVLSHPFALTVYKKYVYWSEWSYQAVYKVNKYNGLDDSIVRKRILRPMEIVIFDKSRQRNVIRNPCKNFNGGCSHLCLLSPKRSRGTCRCPKNSRISSDGKTCESLYSTSRRSLTNSLLDTGIFQ